MRMRRLYLVRPGTPGKPQREVTVPASSLLQVGDKVVVLSDQYTMIVVPECATVDERLLDEAIKLPE